MTEKKASSSGGAGSGFVPPSAEDLDAVLDQYEFIEILGRGGMGAVYKGRQKNLDRLVAIKILPQMEDVGGEMRFAERFQREARSMARLSHPNIISVYDFGETTDGQLFFVMEYIDGTDLHQLIQTGDLTVEHFYGWVPQICEALEYAHSCGIVHRDIKPANIMITREGNVKIADFGLAKAVGPTEQMTQLTMTNMAMGTPDYVAPEVLEAGADIDHRVDLYSLGVMLYQMLTGKVPRGSWKAPSSLNSELDPRIDKLIEKAMDGDRDTRFQKASEISSTLYEIRTKPSESAGKVPTVRKAPKLVTGPVQPRGSTGPVDPRGAAKKKARSGARRPALASAKTGGRGWLWGGGALAVVAAVGLAMKFLGRGGGEPESNPSSASATAPTAIAGKRKGSSSDQGKAKGGNKEKRGTASAANTGTRAPDRSQPGPPSATGPVTKGEWIDLMSVIDPEQDAVKGVWVREGDALKLLADPADATLALPAFSEGSYEFRVVMSGDEAVPMISLILPVGGSQCRAAISTGPGKSPPYFSVIDQVAGLNWQAEDNPIRNSDFRLTRGRRYTFVARVRIEGPDAEIVVSVDDQPLLEWRGPHRNLSAANDWRLARLDQFGIGARSMEAERVFHRIEVKFEDGEFGLSRNLPPESTAVPLDPVKEIDLLTVVDPVNDRVTAPNFTGKNDWMRENGSMVYRSDGKAGKLVAPVAIGATDYEIELLAEPLEGNGQIHVDLPLGDGRILPIVFNHPDQKLIGNQFGPRTSAERLGKPVHVGIRAVQDPDSGRLEQVLIRDLETGETLANVTENADGLGKRGEQHPEFLGEPLTSLFSREDSCVVKTWSLKVFEGEARVLRKPLPPSPEVKASGAWTSLLPKVDLDRDVIEGDWKRDGGGTGVRIDLPLMERNPKARPRFMVPASPEGSYHLEFKFTRRNGDEDVIVHLPVGEKDVVLQLAGWGKWIGLSTFNGKEVGNQKINDTQKALTISNGEPHLVLIEVMLENQGEAAIRVDFDGEPVLEVDTPIAALGRTAAWVFDESDRIGFGALASMVFHSVKFREADGVSLAPGPMPSTARVTPPPPDPLGDRMVEIQNAHAPPIDQAARNRLIGFYLKALETDKGTVGNDAAAVEVIDAEIARMKDGGRIPLADKSGTPPFLVQRRAVVRAELAKLTLEEREAAEARLLALDTELEFLAFDFPGADSKKRIEAARKGLQQAFHRAGLEPPDRSWQRLFDGKSLRGWRSPVSGGFRVEDGAIRTDGINPGYLFFVGPDQSVPTFKDFEFRAKVKTSPGANSGVFFHAGPRGTGEIPSGHEIQIFNSDSNRATGSIYRAKDVDRAAARDGEWFDLSFSVKGRQISVQVDGRQVNQWTEPDDWSPPANLSRAKLGEGTFALQSHQPAGRAVWFRDIRVRELE